MNTETNQSATANLIERYIYAVVRHLPEADRAEVSAELTSLIGDMLDERCGAITPTDKDVRVVLTELGSPQEVAVQYSGAQQQALISGVYFLTYKRILKIVLPIVAIAMPAVVLLSLLDEGTLSSFSANPNLFIGQLFGSLFGGTLEGLVQAFAFITIGFAIVERRRASIAELNEGPDSATSDFLSSLPEIPKKKERIPWIEPLAGIIFSVLFLIVLLGFPQILGGWFEGVGWVPVLQTSVIRSLWLPIGVWAFLGIVKEIVRLVEGRYTWLVALVTVIVNVLILGCVLFVVLHANLMNPAFIAQMELALAGQEGASFVMTALRWYNLVLLAPVLFALVVDSISAIVKAVMYDSGRLSDALRFS